MLSRGLVVYSLLVLCGLAPVGHVLGSPAPKADGHLGSRENLGNNAKRSPPITFPLKRRDPENGGPNGHRIFTPEELERIRKKDSERISLIRSKGEPAKKKRAGWETVSLSSLQYDLLYYVSMQIGTPPQTIDISIDTGSSDLWVQSSTCTTCTDNLIPPVIDGSSPSFDYRESSTFQSTDRRAGLSYADGTAVSGTVVMDTVSLGSYTATNQTFILVLAQNDDFNTAGLLGLGFPSLARSGGDPWWLSVLDQFEEPEFSMFLAQWNEPATSLAAPGGQFTLGGRNSSLYEGEIQFIDVIQELWWTIPFDGILINGTTNLSMSGQYTRSIIDSGTTLMYGPDDVVDAFYATIPGAIQGEMIDFSLAGYWIAPCTTTSNPTFVFNPTVNVTVPSTNVLWLPISQELCAGSLIGTGQITGFSDEPATVVPESTSIPPNPDSEPTTTPSWIFGDAFMKSTYTVFRAGREGETPSIGFAPIKGVDYATDAWIVIGADGNGIDGRIGEAGVVIPGSGDPTASPHVTPTDGSQALPTVVNGETMPLADGLDSPPGNGTTRTWMPGSWSMLLMMAILGCLLN